jgi:DNA polymerase V
MSYFVLADCNNFYASCERLFNPKLHNVPIAVLSNNDGCVVSRSQEAKNLDIKMGVPYFQIKDFCNMHQVFVCSSNYLLYGDLSARVMNILSQESVDLEVYSIDEAFLNYPIPPDEGWAVANCIALRNKLSKWVGLPVSFGIAPTKTLAKIANDLAKKNPEIGVFDLRSSEICKQVLQQYPIGAVWGIGSRLALLLKGMRVQSAWDFTHMDAALVRRKMGVIGTRMQLELQGTSCRVLEYPQAKKSIMTSRSFGSAVTKKEELAEALATYISSACAKLRTQKSCAQALYVFLELSLDQTTTARRQYTCTESFTSPTSDTPYIITAAKKMLEKIFVVGQRYKKCGIILLDLLSEEAVVTDLFQGVADPRRKAAMQVVDALNARFSKNKVFFGAAGVHSKWKMRCDKRSPYNTVEWKCLPIVKA